jgi:hypothetical protein
VLLSRTGARAVAKVVDRAFAGFRPNLSFLYTKYLILVYDLII